MSGTMTDWVWIRRDVIVAIHEMQLAEHGGLADDFAAWLRRHSVARG